MSFEKFIAALDELDQETPVEERTTLVRMVLRNRIEYKFMSAAGAIGATIQYGPYISLVI